MEELLEGIRVLDLSHVLMGPFATKILGEMGAEVIKIEPPWGETSRFSAQRRGTTSTMILSMHQNKKDITLNLKNEKGLEIFKKLVKISDVVVENFSPGTIEGLGLGYDVLKELNPKIIFAQLSGFGQTGPYTHRPSYNSIAQAYSGFMRMTADTIGDGARPIIVPEAPGDTIPGIWAALCIIAAIHYREKTGVGQRIDLAQLDVMVRMMNNSITAFSVTGVTSTERRMMMRTMIRDIYDAKDGYVFIQASSARLAERLAKFFGVEEVKDEMVKEWAKAKTMAEIVDILVKTGIPVAPVISIKETMEDPQVLARNMLIELDYPGVGKYVTTNFPAKFSKTQPKIKTQAPSLGQHNEEVLSTLLGYTSEEIEKLKEEQAI